MLTVHNSLAHYHNNIPHIVELSSTLPSSFNFSISFASPNNIIKGAHVLLFSF